MEVTKIRPLHAHPVSVLSLYILTTLAFFQFFRQIGDIQGGMAIDPSFSLSNRFSVSHPRVLAHDLPSTPNVLPAPVTWLLLFVVQLSIQISLPRDNSLRSPSLSPTPTMQAPGLDKLSKVFSLITLCFSSTVIYLCHYLMTHSLFRM